MPAYGWTINNLVVGKLVFSSHCVGKCIKVKSVTDHGLDFKIKKKISGFFFLLFFSYQL